MSITEDIRRTFREKDNGLMKLIIINVVVFIIANLFIALSRLSGNGGTVVYEILGLSPEPTIFIAHFWTALTYMFFHSDVFHILFNMIWLYWMGQLFVEYIGSKQLISTYILGGVSGGVLFIAIGILFPNTLSNVVLIGASASVMAVVVAIAFLIPNYTINLLFFGGVKLKYLALISFILSTLVDLSDNTGGKIAHIGGALYGYAFFLYYKKGVDLGKPVNALIEWLSNLFKPRSNLKVAYKKRVSDEDYNANKIATEKRTNEILDKISKSGYDSLNKDEKEFLFKQGK